MIDAVALQVLNVLLVEDDPGDVLQTQEAFAQSAISSQLHVADDGEQAIGFLRRTGPYARATAGPDPAGPQPAPPGRPGSPG